MPSVTTIVADTPEASPSSPSVRFAPFDTAVMTRIATAT